MTSAYGVLARGAQRLRRGGRAVDGIATLVIALAGVAGVFVFHGA
jgi:hypothetical protein